MRVGSQLANAVWRATKFVGRLAVGSFVFAVVIGLGSFIWFGLAKGFDWVWSHTIGWVGDRTVGWLLDRLFATSVGHVLQWVVFGAFLLAVVAALVQGMLYSRSANKRRQADAQKTAEESSSRSDGGARKLEHRKNGRRFPTLG